MNLIINKTIGKVKEKYFLFLEKYRQGGLRP